MTTGSAKRAPALFDVARSAGVSHQTVSRVLNGSTQVRPETRERVLAAIDQLGYRPNRAARALVTRRSGTIGVVTSRNALYGPTSVLLSVEAAAREAGLYVSLVSVREPSEGELRSALLHFADAAVEGVVVIGSSADFVETASTVGVSVPTVAVSALEASVPGMYVASIDHFAGAVTAVTHLLELGHVEVAHLRGPAESLDAGARVHGWRSALTAAGLEPGPLVHGDWTAESGYRAGHLLLGQGLPQSIFVANDEMALGLLRALEESGVNVPGEISIVGFDDIPTAANFFPPLTTVRQDFDLLGRHCLAMLVEAISGGEPRARELLPPQLVVRSSTRQADRRS